MTSKSVVVGEETARRVRAGGRRVALRVTVWAVAALLVFAGGAVFAIKKVPPYRALRAAYRSLVAAPQVESQAEAADAAPDEFGRWHRLAGAADASAGTSDDPEILKLLSVGYVGGSRAASGDVGVVAYDRARAQDGLNFYTSGDAPAAVLMDMDGTVRHTWTYPFAKAFPDSAAPEDLPARGFWRRARPFPNGDVLAIFEGWGLIKVDRDSKLLWRSDLHFHHDLDIDDAGRIYALTRMPRTVPEIRPNGPILEDFVTVLDADGRVLRQVSVLAAFENSPYASMVHTTLRGTDVNWHDGDVFHTNTIEWFDGSQADRSPLLARGNVLISCRNMDTIAIVDLDREAVVWALTGQWHAQHQPTLLPDGNLLLFDNRGNRAMSKVIEFDPWTQRIVWGFYGTPENGFYSRTCGSNIRLANGDTLITESDSGRAFEVTPAGEEVWRFCNPARAGDHDEFVATLFEVLRLPADFGADWLNAAGSAVCSRSTPTDPLRKN